MANLNYAFPSSGKKIMGVVRPVKGYNGIVIVQGMPVQINQGVAVVQNQKFLVSESGEVKNDQGATVGQIRNGQFVGGQNV